MNGLESTSYLLGGDARFEITNHRLGSSYAYQIVRGGRPGLYLIWRLLEITAHTIPPGRLYIGVLRPEEEDIGHGSRSPIPRDDPAVAAIAWLWRRVVTGAPIPAEVELRSDGCCSKCRTRTSQASGRCLACQE